MAFWAAAQIHSQRERLAVQHLTLFGFETWLPRIRERRIIRGRRQIVTPALFPGYIFVVIKLQWSAARCCPGVIRLVMDGDRPARVPDQIIEALKEQEVDGFVKLPEPPPRLAPGGRVRVTSGPFRGYLGLLAGMAPRDRVIVLLSLLGGRQRVILPERDVAPDSTHFGVSDPKPPKKST